MTRIKPLHVLIAFAAIAQGVMWSGLFVLIAPGLLAYIGGLPAGFAIVGIVTLAANALPRTASKRAREWGWAVLIILMVVEPTVLGIVNWWAMPVEFQALSVAPIVAGGASLTITLALVLGALLDRGLVPVEKPVKPPKKLEKPEAKPAEPQVEPIEPEIPVFACQVAGCTAEPFGSQSALNAHQRKHKRVTGYKVSFEPVIIDREVK